MVFSSTLYSRSVSWYATNALLGRVNELMTEFWDYIDLRPENKTLLAENARLRQTNIRLMRQMQEIQAYRELPRLHATDSVSLREGSFVIARVLNRASRIGEVFFTIDKGGGRWHPQGYGRNECHWGRRGSVLDLETLLAGHPDPQPKHAPLVLPL